MPEKRCRRTTVRFLVALGAATLIAPLATVPAVAKEDRFPQDLLSADRIGLVDDAGALRIDEQEAVRSDGASTGDTPRKARTGTAVFPEQPLEESTDTVEVNPNATGPEEDLRTEVRGLRADGMWTEWHTVTTGEGGRVTFPEHVSGVQVRVELEGSEVALEELDVRRIEPLMDSATTDDVAEPFSARLFATRIGLVGETTANGHVVRPDDHFAALPSRRGLANRGGGEYTVRVCSTGEFGPDAEGDPDTHQQRCVYLPVWDVGPWNITDDHWNDDRESWRDLDQGRPQAQAAYAEGYNGGVDGFGRQVLNPAGIDLADGAFRHGLQMPTNGWVRVDYLWTGRYRAHAEIITETQAEPVVVRNGPGARHDIVGLAAAKANVDVACRTHGDEAGGPFGTSDVWYRIGQDHYVPSAFADGGADAPDCDE